MKTHKHHEHGQSWMLAGALMENPKTKNELIDYYRTFGRRFFFLLST
ncbi:MAG: hypothetical protein ACLFST_02205 [Spirochaetia bacterium]